MALPPAGTKPPDRTTIKPSGVPAWPFLLLAGGEKKGKTYWALEGSGSDLIHRTFLIEAGDGQAHEYGAIEGVSYEIVPHDGSYRDIYNAVWWAVEQPAAEGKVNLVILDSGSVLWDLICSELQLVADRRFERKVEQAKRDGKKPPEPGPVGVDITQDLWNIGKKRWHGVVDLLRYRPAPSIVTARLEEVTVVKNGQPTTEREWRVKAEKTLPYDADGIIEFKRLRRPVLVGLRSVRFPVGEADKGIDLRDKGIETFDAFVRKLGLGEVAKAAPRSHVAVDAAAGADEIEREDDGGERAPQADPKQTMAQRLADDAIVAPTFDDLRAYRDEAIDKKLLGYPVTVDDEPLPLTKLLDRLAVRHQQHEPPPPETANEPSSFAEPPPPEPPQEPTQQQQPQQQREPERVTPQERMRRSMLAEVRAQAAWLGVELSAYGAPLLERAGVDKAAAVPVTTLREWIFAQRGRVIDTLREQGRASLADAYQAQGMTMPLDLDALSAQVENEPAGEPANA